MLSLTYRPDRVQRADNMLPMDDKSMATRGGALQIVSGDIDAAMEWNGRILFVRDGSIWLYTAAGETNIATAGPSFDLASFQALLSGALREDRAYVADGTNPLWYVSQDLGGGYSKKTFVNTVLDGGGVPYPIPVPVSVTAWRSRLFVSEAMNRIRHSDDDNPVYWDPLFSLEFQAGAPSAVLDMRPFGEQPYDVLAVGTSSGLWKVTGTSQYDWQTGYLDPFHGIVGIGTLATDGVDLYYGAPTGTQKLGTQQAVTEYDLAEAFSVQDPNGKILLSPSGQYLLVVQHGEVYVLNTRTGLFGIVSETARGPVSLSGQLGWYGEDGIWIMQAPGHPDTRQVGDQIPVQNAYGTWPQYPNPDGRALLRRVFITVKGEPGKTATFSAIPDGATDAAYTTEISLSDGVDSTLSFGDGDVADWPEKPVRREVTPMLGAESFEMLIEADGFMQIINVNPVITFGPPEGESN